MPPRKTQKDKKSKKKDLEESVAKLKISKEKKKRRNSSEMDVEDDDTETDGKQEEEEKPKSEPYTGRQTRSIASALESPNYLFYTNQIKSTPSGDFIDQIHETWFGNYDRLEDHHGYIQWLFPVFESAGMNSRSSSLSKAEAKLIRENVECAKRVIKSLMLNFYGMRLVDEETGEIDREPDIWRDRYRNLSTNSHNFLRISELGFRRYKQPFVDHLIKEVKKNEVLKACKRSLDDFWIPLLDEKSAAYIKKTRENPEDRTESVYFKQ